MRRAKITVTQLLDTAAEVVKGREDHVYQPYDDRGGCVYRHEDEPGCLIGQILHRLGWSLDELGYFDNQDHSAAGTLRVWADERAREVAVVMQARQDGDGVGSRKTWGECLEIGRKKAADLRHSS